MGRGNLVFLQNGLRLEPDVANLVPWSVEFGRVDRHAVIGMARGSACITIEPSEAMVYPLLSTLISENWDIKAVKMEADVLAQSQIQCFIQQQKPFQKGCGACKLV